MATADEILNAMQDGTELQAEEGELLIIDNDLRTITIPPEIANIGVESDDNVKRLHFQMPRQYGEFDLSEFDIRINYLAANNTGDIYVVTDKAVSGDNITFSWLVGRSAFTAQGTVRFIVCLKKTNQEGVVEQEYNTTVATLQALEGIEPSGQIVEDNPEVIESILKRLDVLEENGGGGGTSGTTNYENLSNKPQLNGVTLEGNKTLDQVGVLAKNQGASNSGKYLSVGSDGNVVPVDAPSGGAVDAEQIKQAVNGYLEENPVSGMTAEQEQQLNQNTTDVADLKSAIDHKLNKDNWKPNKILGTDNLGNIVEKDTLENESIKGYDYDLNSDFNMSANIENGNLFAVLQYPSSNKNIENIALNGKTYKEIFVDGNLCPVLDFENGTEGLNAGVGNPEISSDEYVSPTHSLKAFGSSSQQYKMADNLIITASTQYYVALKAKCIRYNKGSLGYNDGAVIIGATHVTDEFETFSQVTSATGIKSVYVGSYSNADLDGYVDDIVVINLTNIFGADNIPEKEELDSAYEEYINIISGGTNYYEKKVVISGDSDSENENDYTSEDCINKFMELVNKKAKYFGMSNSNFTSPSGAGGNTSCAKDLAISGYYACGYREILDIWKNKTYEVDIKGANARKTNVASTLMSESIGEYKIYGGKTGSWSNVENLVAIAEVKGKIYACCVMDCGSSSNRFTAMKELLDVIANESGEVNTASAACAYELGTQIPQLYDVAKITPVYSKQENLEIIPASVTKIMTAMTALDFCPYLGEKMEFISSDLTDGSGAIFQAGDIVSLKDAIAALLLPSSNMAATAIARNIGKLYLERVGN